MNSNPQVYCTNELNKETDGILLKARSFDISNHKRKKLKVMLDEENPQVQFGVFSCSSLNEVEDFYLYNLSSPTFKQENKIKPTKKQSVSLKLKQIELLLSGYFRNLHLSDFILILPKNVSQRIKDNCNDDNIINYKPTVNKSNKSKFKFTTEEFSEELLDKQLGIKKINKSARRRANYSGMKVEEIISLKFSVHELLSLNLVTRLMRDQYGSRYLQNVLKCLRKSQCIEMITLLINYLISHEIDLVNMSEDIYGNYLIQLFFVRGNDLHHETLFQYFIYKSTLRLCKSKYGCRVIQKILTCVKNRNKLIQLVECFRHQLCDNNAESIHDCLLCCNTNHVVQAMIELKLPYKTMIFIRHALERNLVLYCENVYGCRVVQAFIKVYADKLDIDKLCVNNAHLFLSQVKYGNYVIQCIINKNEWYSNLSSINKFRNQLITDTFKSDSNILYLSKDKHGSNVIETCIRVANDKQIDILIATICANRGFLLKQLICDKFGNYIPKTLLTFCNTKKQIRILINTIHSYITNLYQHYHPYKHCSEFINKCQAIKFDMDKQYHYNNKY